MPAPAPERGPVPPPKFQRSYARWTAAADLGALVAAVVLYALWGAPPPPWPLARELAGVGFVLGGVLALWAVRAWEPYTLGQGTDEFRRLFRGLCGLGVLIALLGLGLKEPWLRPYAFGVAPSAFALALLGRWILRLRLHSLRMQGKCMWRVLAVGSEEAVAELIDRSLRAPRAGWRVTGACVPGGRAAVVHGVPVLGDLDSLAATARRFGHHVIAVSHTQGWNPRRLHALVWDLEGSGTRLVVDPGLMEIAGPRVQIDTVDGVPVLRLSEPTFAGATRLVKNASDAVGATLALLLAAPLLLAVAVAVKCGDGGPVFYRQQRVGRHGRPFTMLKFRSMAVDADGLLADLWALNEGAGPLFKMAEDPRVTPIGRFLRRYSLDELPQLLNVLSGSMSLVGPRPPLVAEVAQYDREACRRLLVKPGMTGLWQVSGRSDLTWEASVRLDRRYVENWTLLLDVWIVWRTLGTVVRGSGAY